MSNPAKWVNHRYFGEKIFDRLVMVAVSYSTDFKTRIYNRTLCGWSYKIFYAVVLKIKNAKYDKSKKSLPLPLIFVRIDHLKPLPMQK